MTLDSPYKQSGINWKNTGLFFLTILLFSAALFYRRADAFTNPQFWAEDGVIFFMEQDNASAFQGFKNYNGYIHFLPRVIAFLPKLFSIQYEHVPTVYNYSAYAITLLYLSLAWIMLPYKSLTKSLMILSAGILPISAEIYMNLTNIQWFSSIGLLILILPIKIHTLSRSILLGIAVFIAGLTGPFSFILLPLFIIKLIKFRKSKIHVIPFSIAIATGLIQCIFLFNHFQQRVQPAIPVPAYHVCLTLYNIIKQVVLPNSTQAISFKLYHCIPIIILLITIIGVLRYNILHKKFYNLMILTAITLFFSFTLYANWPYEWLLTPLGIGARYFFVPFLLIAWYIFIQLENRWGIAVVSFAFMLLVFILNGNKVKSRFIHFQWKKEVKEYYETGDQIAPTNPFGWYIIFKKRN